MTISQQPTASEQGSEPKWRWILKDMDRFGMQHVLYPESFNMFSYLFGKGDGFSFKDESFALYQRMAAFPEFQQADESLAGRNAPVQSCAAKFALVLIGTQLIPNADLHGGGCAVGSFPQVNNTERAATDLPVQRPRTASLLLVAHSSSNNQHHYCFGNEIY